MRKIRVLVVDDSTVVRRLVSDALASDPELEVAGTAANGKIALDKLPQVCPDVVTLDIEMPDLNGLETLPLLRARYPQLPVIMFSTLTQKGAVDTLNALSLGATDYVTKPSNVGSVTAGIAAVKNELIPKIKALCPVGPRPKPAVVVANSLSARMPSRPAANVDLLAIGVSTGGPNALAALFSKLPADFPVPIVIVQHMPPVFTRYLADRLSNSSPLKVYEAKGGELLHPGAAWLAPGDFHMTIVPQGNRWATRLNQGPHENSCRPAVDVLFRSVADCAGAGALAVVLTGMGHDGQRGCESIRHAGGQVIAQDEATSVVWGMPGAVANAGLAHQILPLDRIPGEVTRLACRTGLAALTAGRN